MEAIMRSDFVAGEKHPKNGSSLCLRDVGKHLWGYRHLLEQTHQMSCRIAIVSLPASRPLWSRCIKRPVPARQGSLVCFPGYVAVHAGPVMRTPTQLLRTQLRKELRFVYRAESSDVCIYLCREHTITNLGQLSCPLRCSNPPSARPGRNAVIYTHTDCAHSPDACEFLARWPGTPSYKLWSSLPLTASYLLTEGQRYYQDHSTFHLKGALLERR
jgi:hypothetical protein